jgi:acyl-[acyl-carrier-protein]-phospholipid O-acyltransferase/long-chain-fatty-acid--[acyl-carrier-protein] ligase
VSRRKRVEGPPPAAGAGPVLYLMAHRTRLDSVLAALFLPNRPLAVLPAEEVRSLWMRLILRGVEHAVMDVNDPGTVKKLIRMLEAGRAVALFPEGRVVRSPTVMKNYGVPALAAGRTHALVIPVVPRVVPSWLPRVVLRLYPGLRADAEGQTGLRGARARRTWVTQRLQRCLEDAVLDARERQSLFEGLLSATARTSASCGPT